MPEVPLPTDSPQFKLFEEACGNRDLVRIRYLAAVRDDPALPEQWRKDGLPTVIEGNAIAIDETEITFTQAVIVKSEAAASVEPVFKQRSIVRGRVLKIARIGETEPALET
jgi:hypothetical protein